MAQIGPGGLCVQVRFTRPELEYVIERANEHKLTTQQYIIAASTGRLPAEKQHKSYRSRAPKGVKETA